MSDVEVSSGSSLVQIRVKIKHRSHVDGIVGAVIGPVSRPEASCWAATPSTVS